MEEAEPLPGPAEHVLRVHVPPYLLSAFSYTVSIAIKLEDTSDGAAAILSDGEAASFSAEIGDSVASLTGDAAVPNLGLVHPSIKWSVDSAWAPARIVS